MTESVARVLDAEASAGLQVAADGICMALHDFLHEQKRAGRTVAAYGAAAKGNTLLNYCGIKGNWPTSATGMASS